MTNEDNETWLLEAGDAVIRKKSKDTYLLLSPFERLIYCLWVADYGMRNAGDLNTAADLHPKFLDDGKSAAQELGFPCSTGAFSMSSGELEQRYFGLFDKVLGEIRAYEEFNRG